jgi:hypothetical protein
MYDFILYVVTQDFTPFLYIFKIKIRKFQKKFIFSINLVNFNNFGIFIIFI